MLYSSGQKIKGVLSCFIILTFWLQIKSFACVGHFLKSKVGVGKLKWTLIRSRNVPILIFEISSSAKLSNLKMCSASDIEMGCNSFWRIVLNFVLCVFTEYFWNYTSIIECILYYSLVWKWRIYFAKTRILSQKLFYSMHMYLSYGARLLNLSMILY